MPCARSPIVLVLMLSLSSSKDARMAASSLHEGLVHLAGMQYSNPKDLTRRASLSASTQVSHLLW